VSFRLYPWGGDMMYKKVTPAVKEIIEKYQYDQTIKRYSNKHYFGNNSIFAGIESKRDVEIAERHVITRLDTYKKTYPLHEDDIVDLEKAIGRYELAVKKVIQCYKYTSNDFDYTAEELQMLIDKIFEFYSKLDELKIRKACQD
jgi:hypothetical protein